VVTFANRPEKTCPLTLSHSVLLRTVDEAKALSGPDEAETNLSDAIAVGVQRLRSAGPRRKVLVLLTDGEQTLKETRSGWTPRQSAQIAGSLDVPIYTIDAGPAGDSSEARAEAARTLTELAHITRGLSFRAGDTPGLLNAYRAIDGLERSPLETFQYRRYYEGYPWFTLAAFVCLVAASALEMTVWRRLP
jgi:Ca-activated chloride channel family protein